MVGGEVPEGTTCNPECMLGDYYDTPSFHPQQIVGQTLPNFFLQPHRYLKLCPSSHASLQVLSWVQG